MNDLEKISIIRDFVKYCYTKLNINTAPTITIINDKKWVKHNKSFGSYAPETNEITVFLGKRNLADFLRTLGHELVHHSQNEKDMLHVQAGETGSEIENEANAQAGVLLRIYGKINNMIYEHKNKL